MGLFRWASMGYKNIGICVKLLNRNYKKNSEQSIGVN